MPKQALVPANNLQHNVPALLDRERESLTALARVYFLTKVAGQARATIEAKKRDLERFLRQSRRIVPHGQVSQVPRNLEQ